MVREENIGQYLESLSSNAPVPGGGSAAGLIGAEGVSLMLMAIRLTSGKKTYAEYEEELNAIAFRGEQLKERFLLLADRDEEAYLELSKAYKLPKETEEERGIRESALKAALETATAVPLDTMKESVEALTLLRFVALHSAKTVVSDAGVAAAALRASLTGASMNVRINLKSMADGEEKDALRSESEELIEAGQALADEIVRIVAGRIG